MTCTRSITWWSRYCFFTCQEKLHYQVDHAAQATTIVLQCRLRAIDCDRQHQQIYELLRHQTTRCRRVQPGDVLSLRGPLRIRNGFSVLYRSDCKTHSPCISVSNLPHIQLNPSLGKKRHQITYNALLSLRNTWPSVFIHHIPRAVKRRYELRINMIERLIFSAPFLPGCGRSLEYVVSGSGTWRSENGK